MSMDKKIGARRSHSIAAKSHAAMLVRRVVARMENGGEIRHGSSES